MGKKRNRNRAEKGLHDASSIPKSELKDSANALEVENTEEMLGNSTEIHKEEARVSDNLSIGKVVEKVDNDVEDADNLSIGKVEEKVDNNVEDADNLSIGKVEEKVDNNVEDADNLSIGKVEEKVNNDVEDADNLSIEKVEEKVDEDVEDQCLLKTENDDDDMKFQNDNKLESPLGKMAKEKTISNQENETGKFSNYDNLNTLNNCGEEPELQLNSIDDDYYRNSNLKLLKESLIIGDVKSKIDQDKIGSVGLNNLSDEHDVIQNNKEAIRRENLYLKSKGKLKKVNSNSNYTTMEELNREIAQIEYNNGDKFAKGDGNKAICIKSVNEGKKEFKLPPLKISVKKSECASNIMKYSDPNSVEVRENVRKENLDDIDDKRSQTIRKSITNVAHNYKAIDSIITSQKCLRLEDRQIQQIVRFIMRDIDLLKKERDNIVKEINMIEDSKAEELSGGNDLGQRRDHNNNYYNDTNMKAKRLQFRKLETEFKLKKWSIEVRLISLHNKLYYTYGVTEKKIQDLLAHYKEVKSREELRLMDFIEEGLF